MGDRKGITRPEVTLRRACVPSESHSQGLEQEVHVDLDSLLDVDSLLLGLQQRTGKQEDRQVGAACARKHLCNARTLVGLRCSCTRYAPQPRPRRH